MLFCPKILLPSKCPKNAICLRLRLRKIDQSHAALFIFTRFSWSQPKTNCIFRTFRVKESFWTKKQSWKLSKVDIKKWRPFFVFVCLNGCHFLNHKISRNLAVKIWNYCSWETQLGITMTKFIKIPVKTERFFLGFFDFGRAVSGRTLALRQRLNRDAKCYSCLHAHFHIWLGPI